MSEPLWLKATDQIETTCKIVGEPITQTQRELIAGSLATWFDHQGKELAQLKQRELVLVSACKLALDAFEKNHCIDWSVIERAIDPAKTADQVLRWHVEWMRTLPVKAEKSEYWLEWDIADAVDKMATGTKLVAIPKLP